MLKGDESALIAATMGGRSLAEIAVAAGVSISTAQRRLRDPDILAELAAARAQHRREFVGKLNGEVGAAINRLSQLLEHEDARVALRAINLTLTYADRLARTVVAEEQSAVSDLREAGDLR